jgi:murein L,D-transpeptidase YcbB/YkuD
VPRLRQAFAEALEGKPAAVARAELMLSQAFADYVVDRRTPPEGSDMVYVDAELAPPKLTAREVLDEAGAAPSLRAHLAEVRRMHPIYEGLRRGLASRDPAQQRIIWANLERARAIPANPGRRYIVVDAAGARLWMFEDGQVRDSMRVIVGKPSQKTPMLAGLIRFTALNPYWNIPPDLVPTRVAKHVLKEGTGFLRRDRLQLLSDWSDGAHRLDPAKVDWRKVAAGRQLLRVRQLPGPGNMLSSMKFMMPNDLDIYLHDTPDKASFAQADRRLSSGCVRVEDAARLARWFYDGRPPVPSGAAEQRVDLPEPVPVYITYLTALPTGKGGIAFQQDVYGRDAALLARLESEPRSSSRRKRG